MTQDAYKTFRLRGIPIGSNDSSVQELVARALSIRDDVDCRVRSLADDPHLADEMVATLEFSPIPPRLRSVAGDSELDVCVDDMDLVFDAHFGGFTPLETGCDLDVVAISGLNGHAFGSFKKKNGTFMWLRDGLSRDLPNARVLIYGYDSHLVNSTSFQNILDLGGKFHNALRAIRKGSKRPLVIVSHSLGGIIVREAISSMAKSFLEEDRNTHQIISGIFFFGVPSQGMNIQSLIPMVGDQPNRALLDSLGPNSAVLRKQSEDLCTIVNSAPFEIVNFYETQMSPTARLSVTGKWEMNGPSTILVTAHSAANGQLHNSERYHVHAVDRTHSEIVKFGSRRDETYTIVLDHLRRMLRSAQESLTVPLQDLTAMEKDCLLSLAFQEEGAREVELNPADGTCEWLLQHHRFRHWMAKSNGILWIRGKPGSGKSTIMKWMLQCVKSQTRGREVVASFFIHGRGTDLQKTTLGLYRSLLHQLYPYAPNEFSELTQKFKRNSMLAQVSKTGWAWTVDELRQYFLCCIPLACSKRPICLLIDALDEAGEAKALQIVNDLETLLGSLPGSASTLRICFSCRHYPQITFNDAERISMEKVNQDDIALFTQKSISNISRLTDAEKDILHAEIVRRSKGVFQWAALVVQNVRRMKLKGKSFRFILESVQQVPDDLNRLYGELLALAENRTQTVKLFQWVLYARNPLSISELRHALSLDQDMSEDSIAQYEEHPEYPNEKDMENVLNDLSVGLVEVLESQKVEFIHQSVPDYLLEGGMALIEDSDIVSTTFRGHFQLSRSCLRYIFMEEIETYGRKLSQELSMPCNHCLKTRRECSCKFPKQEFKTETAKTISAQFPFLPYAYTTWTYHAIRANLESADRGAEIDHYDLLKFFDWPFDRERLSGWTHFNEVLGKACQDLPVKSSRLLTCGSLVRHNEVGPRGDIFDDVSFWPCKSRLIHFLCMAGIRPPILKMIQHGGIDMNERGYKGLTPLLFAACGGNVDICRDLVEAGGTDVSITGPGGRSALHLACLSGAMDIINILLSAAIAVDFPDVYLQSPLFFAVAAKNEAVVERLIAANAKVNISDFVGRTPLSHAAEVGVGPIIHFLMNAGADCEIRSHAGQGGYTPLFFAISKGHTDAACQLLRRGANCNARSMQNGFTPLHLAAKLGHAEIVELLLVARATIDVRDDEGRTPISHAAQNGFTTIVRILIRSGARVNAMDSSGKTAIWYAGVRLYHDIVQDLTDAGACVTALEKVSRIDIFAARLT